MGLGRRAGVGVRPWLLLLLAWLLLSLWLLLAWLLLLLAWQSQSGRRQRPQR
jgi:hypothetical protein